MYSIKTFAVAACLATTISATARGQSDRPFRDSWFWGLRTGVLSYGSINPTDPTVGSSTLAPMVGGDWLITRTHGGLYVSFAQAFLSTQGVVLNGPTSADSGFRTVDVSGLRRVDIAAMAFPGDYVKWHPYFGVGVSFRYVANAVPVGPFASSKQIDFANSAVNDVKATIGPAFIAGAQYRTRWASVFGQAMVSTMGRDFLLANGHNASFATEFGIRYNIGSSIDH